MAPLVVQQGVRHMFLVLVILACSIFCPPSVEVRRTWAWDTFLTANLDNSNLIQVSPKYPLEKTQQLAQNRAGA
eukprot:1094725-Pelagomonas_calceolata.AAC.2